MRARYELHISGVLIGTTIFRHSAVQFYSYGGCREEASRLPLEKGGRREASPANLKPRIFLFLFFSHVAQQRWFFYTVVAKLSDDHLAYPSGIALLYHLGNFSPVIFTNKHTLPLSFSPGEFLLGDHQPNHKHHEAIPELLTQQPSKEMGYSSSMGCSKRASSIDYTGRLSIRRQCRLGELSSPKSTEPDII
jgi:hypothetical protein